MRRGRCLSHMPPQARHATSQRSARQGSPEGSREALGDNIETGKATALTSFGGEVVRIDVARVLVDGAGGLFIIDVLETIERVALTVC